MDAKSNEMNTEAMEILIRQRTPMKDLMSRVSCHSLSGYLNHLMGRQEITGDALAELSAMNPSSLYRILNGSTKAPRRNLLLRLAMTLQLSFQETQTLLKLGCRAGLSSSRGRDIIISDGIIFHKSIDEVNTRLLEYHLPDLYGRDS